jgi:PAS domain S-box-containing protein
MNKIEEGKPKTDSGQTGESDYPKDYGGLLHQFRSHEIELARRNEELRQMTIALELSREHYRELYDQAPVGYLTLIAKGIIVEANETAAKLMGIERKHLINKHLDDFIEDEFKERWRKHFLLATQTIGKNACELPFRHEQGNIIYVHLDCLSIDADDAPPPQIRVTLTEITKLKKAEHELRIAAAAFETQEGIVVADSNKLIVRVNKAFTRLTGYGEDEAVSKMASFLRSKRYGADFHQQIWASVDQDGCWHGEIWGKHKDGREIPFLLNITSVRGSDGKISHYVSSFTDITLQKQAEQVLLDVRERLENQVANTQEELQKTKAETTEINAALNVLLKHRETDKAEAQISLSYEVEATILPLLKKLKGVSSSNAQIVRIVDMLEANLQHIMKSYGRANHIDAAYQKLTPIETQVAFMVKLGQPTKTIAATLYITSGTVNIHRKHIRKKLGLDSKTNLQRYLQSLSD